MIKKDIFKHPEIDEKFWKEINTTTDYSEFVISIVTRIITGEDLMKVNRKQLFSLIYNMSFTNNLTESDFKIRIRKFRQSIPNFLELLDSVLTQVEDSREKMYKLQTSLAAEIVNLPESASSLDPSDVVAFIRTLKKEFYSFSEAEKLLNISRQTLRKYTNENQKGLKIVRPKKAEYLTRESIINFFRNRYYEKNGYSIF